MKLATSVSMTNLVVAFGGDVNVALLIDEAYEGFGFLRRSRIDVAQQPLQREGGSPNQIGRIFDGLWWNTIHLNYYSSAVAVAADRLAESRLIWGRRLDGNER